jgi:hypothetical protein
VAPPPAYKHRWTENLVGDTIPLRCADNISHHHAPHCAQIIVLDEAKANVDVETAALIHHILVYSSH